MGPNHPLSTLQGGVNPSLYGGPSGALTPPDYLTLIPQGPSLPPPGEINMDALARSGTGIAGPNTGFNVNAPSGPLTVASPLPTDMDISTFYDETPLYTPGAGTDPNVVTGATQPATGAQPQVETAGIGDRARQLAEVGGGAQVPAPAAGALPPGAQTTATLAGEAIKPPTTWESVKDIFSPSGKDWFTASKDLFFPSDVSAMDIVAKQFGETPGTTFGEILSKNASQGLTETTLREMLNNAKDLLADQAFGAGYNPGFLRKWGPLAAAGTGIMAATGGFEEQPMEEVEEPWGGKTGWDLLKADPAKYSVFPAFGGPYSVPGGASGGDVQKQCVAIPHRNTGGNFPRRDGAITGPGTGTSDDIRAMLSDGEFVMTADAVRGAGNGDRRRGVRKMYEVMRGFEGVA